MMVMSILHLFLLRIIFVLKNKKRGERRFGGVNGSLMNSTRSVFELSVYCG